MRRDERAASGRENEDMTDTISMAFSVSMDCNHCADLDNTCVDCTIKIVKIAEAAEARAAQLEQERNEYKDAYARFADEIIELQAQLARLTLERDNALAERDRANAGFSALSKEYSKAMTRLAAHGEKVTA